MTKKIGIMKRKIGYGVGSSISFTLKKGKGG